MKSSSSEAYADLPEPDRSAPSGTVLRGRWAAEAVAPATPELGSGTWTRLGDASVLGDPVTEATLAALAEATQSAARAQGYAVGWSQGRREAAEEAERTARFAAEQRLADDERRATEHAVALAALEAAAAGFAAATAVVADRVEAAAAGLAYDLTEALLDRELALAGPGVDAVRRALALLPPTGAVRVRLAPRDASSEATAALAGHGVPVLADPALAPGEAVVEADDHVLDGRFSTALDRVRAALAVDGTELA